MEPAAHRHAGRVGHQPRRSSSIIVAVVDTGITLGQPDAHYAALERLGVHQHASSVLEEPGPVGVGMVNPRDLVFTSNNDVLDMDGHSTHVASTIGEDTNNLVGLAGMAFNVKIMPIKVCIGYWETDDSARASTDARASRRRRAVCPDSAIIAGMHFAADAGAKVINLSLGGAEPIPADPGRAHLRGRQGRVRVDRDGQ